MSVSFLSDSILVLKTHTDTKTIMRLKKFSFSTPKQGFFCKYPETLYFYCLSVRFCSFVLFWSSIVFCLLFLRSPVLTKAVKLHDFFNSDSMQFVFEPMNNTINFFFVLLSHPRENEVRERIPHTCPSSYENFFQSILGSLSILRMAPHWSVKRLTSCSHRNNKQK